MGQHVWHPISSVPMTDNHPLAHRQPADIEGQFPMLHSNSNEDAIRALINAIDQATNLRLAEIQKRNLGARASEIAHQEADEAKRALRTATISFDSAIPATVSTIRRPENAFKLARVRGSLAGMDTPVHVESPRNADATLTDLIGERSDETSASVITSLMSRISISGDGDDEIETNRFIDRKLINTFQEDGHRYATWEFLIYVVLSTSASQESESQETNRPSRTYRTYEFFLVDARPLRTAIQVVAPSPGEIAAAEALYGSDPSVIDTIMGFLVSLLEVVHLDRLPILAEAMRFQITASATNGRRGHGLLIGPPAVGKSTIHKVAEYLQPVFKFALPTKVTEAGLIGDGYSSKNHRRPGLIPMAHTGAFSVQDFNQANGTKNQRFCAVFTNTMADGKISDASAAKVEYEASVSIILDANRKSEVRRTSTNKHGFDRLVEDIGIPMNILSRMTHIAEIPRDPQTQLLVASEIMRRKDSLPLVEKKVLEERLRLARVYLALMRDRHKYVIIDPEVREYLANQVLSACETTVDRFNQHPEFADFMTRLGQQALDLVQANARLHNRGEAKIADVDAAFPFLWRKLDWIKTTLFGGQAETQVVNANAKARRALIKMHVTKWHQRTCTAVEVRRRIGLNSASLSTIEDDLRSLIGEPDAQGGFTLMFAEPSDG